jgi:hypothetical protein
MSIFDQLATTAEIAIALGGFSALVAILQRTGEYQSKAEIFRLQIMLEASLFVVALSIAPGVIRELGVSQPNIWRISAALFLMIDAVIGVAAWIRGREFTSQYDWGTKSIVYALSFSADAVMLLILIGIHPAPVQGMYLLSIYFNLVLAGFIFIRFAAVNFSRDG